MFTTIMNVNFLPQYCGFRDKINELYSANPDG